MNYEEKYKQALERASKLRVQNPFDTVGQMVEHIFPELAESEDERIRKGLIKAVSFMLKGGVLKDTDVTREEALAWLEKQGEQPVDKIEPKFKVGDWVIDNIGDIYQIEKATEIESEHIFGYTIVGGGYFNDNNNGVRLWSIEDAKDGDVLATEDGRPFIIRCMVESKNDIPSAYCGINARPIEAFIITGYSPGISKWTNSKVHPATKEQRDLLFQKMKEAGYEWDTEKKEVKKIEPKTINADEVIA